MIQGRCGHLMLCVLPLDKAFYLHCISPHSPYANLWLGEGFNFNSKPFYPAILKKINFGDHQLYYENEMKSQRGLEFYA